MLWFIGLGISGFKSMPMEAMDVLSNADIIYLEQFTSPIGKSDLSKIKNATKGEFKLAKRWLVEDGKEILKKTLQHLKRLHDKKMQ
jgi:diphthamide biosynthesis methyltransferase